MTAAEWLYKNYLDNPLSNEDVIYNINVFEKAKEMEKKEQQKLGIIMAIFAEELGDKKCIELLNKADKYYEQTFKNTEK